MFFLISTPIGNLSDISARALDTLRACDTLLCEDTRVSRTLLRAHQIDKPLLSCHAFNERKREAHVIDLLRQGRSVGLLSDAGTPALCDPGARLVDRCHRENIPVRAIPGPCALITALSLSGYVGAQFQFVGYLPRKKGPLTRLFDAMLDYSGASIAYETPHRLLKTLTLLKEHAPHTPLFLVKELTKKYESHFRGTAASLSASFATISIKGEWVLILLPPSSSPLPQGLAS